MADRKLTDLELERHLAGDLDAARFADATDADRTRLGELRAEQESFLRSVDVDMEVKRIQQRVARATPEKRTWWRWLVPAGALAAAAAALLVFLKRPTGDEGPIGPDIQVKGDDITLVVHLATGADSRRLTSGDTVSPGDRIRFEVNAQKPGFVAIIGIDGSGTPTIYHPDQGTGPTAFDPTSRLLPGAIQLDATPGDEHFYAVYSAHPFVLDAVIPALAGNVAMPAGVSKADVVLHKK